MVNLISCFLVCFIISLNSYCQVEITSLKALQLRGYNFWENCQTEVSPLFKEDPIGTNTLISEYKLKIVEFEIVDSDSNKRLIEKYHYSEAGMLTVVETNFFDHIQINKRMPGKFVKYEYDSVTGLLKNITEEFFAFIDRSDPFKCDYGTKIIKKFNDDFILMEILIENSNLNTSCRMVYHLCENGLIKRIDYFTDSLYNYSYSFNYQYY